MSLPVIKSANDFKLMNALVNEAGGLLKSHRNLEISLTLKTIENDHKAKLIKQISEYVIKFPQHQKTQLLLTILAVMGIASGAIGSKFFTSDDTDPSITMPAITIGTISTKKYKINLKRLGFNTLVALSTALALAVAIRTYNKEAAIAKTHTAIKGILANLK